LTYCSSSPFCREETVIALLRLGASPGAVDDPTPASPGGKTAADLASSRGHKGIAGYLAEADLVSHLSSLTVNENITDSAAATIATEKSIETAALVQSDFAAYENLSLKGSLAAFRKSAHAAALIQAAFRARSFNQRQLTKSRNDTSEVSFDLVALGSLNKVKKLNHFEEYLHSAAVKIQQKYRGWKGRKEFLKIRNRIVKIQVLPYMCALLCFLHQIIIFAFQTIFLTTMSLLHLLSIHNLGVLNLNIMFRGRQYIY
jgi:hypothetical protein